MCPAYVRTVQLHCGLFIGQNIIEHHSFDILILAVHFVFINMIVCMNVCLEHSNVPIICYISCSLYCIGFSTTLYM